MRKAGAYGYCSHSLRRLSRSMRWEQSSLECLVKTTLLFHFNKGLTINIADVDVRDVVGRGEACFDFGALRVVILANGNAASPIRWEEHPGRGGEHTTSRIADGCWCSCIRAVENGEGCAVGVDDIDSEVRSACKGRVGSSSRRPCG